MSKLLPLFSSSFRERLSDIAFSKNNPIAKYLLEADKLIEGFNKWFPHEDLQTTLFSNDDYLTTWASMNKQKIDELINDSVRMIDLRMGEFELSFLPKGKSPVYSHGDRWSRKNRQTGKPTRIIKRLINSKEFKDTDFEIFNNLLKSIFNNEHEFKIVEGKDITHWYHHSTYAPGRGGSLNGSCMQHSECQNYFWVYENYAKMLILTNKNNELVGRAILWEQNDKVFMDRVYCIDDYIENTFINYAEENGWYHREHNHVYHNNGELNWYTPDSDYKDVEEHTIIISMSCKPDYLPYMDTLRYYYEDYEVISNSHNLSGFGGYDYLEDTEGYFGSFDTYECMCCSTTERVYDGENPENLYWSGYHEDYLCESCMVHSSILDDYIDRRQTIEVEGHGKFPDCEWVKTDYGIISIDGLYYFKDDESVYFDDESQEYKLVE